MQRLSETAEPRLADNGVRQAVGNIRDTLSHAVMGVDAHDQAEVDRRLLEADPSPQKSQLGGNAILGVSLAAARAGATSLKIPLKRQKS